MFVLLEHTQDADRHWDLLIDVDGRSELAAWRLFANPLESADPIPAVPNLPHRRLYLNYEGPLSGGRGNVRRVDRGEAKIMDGSPPGMRLRLTGERLRGEFELSPAGKDRYLFRSVSADPSPAPP